MKSVKSSCKCCGKKPFPKLVRSKSSGCIVLMQAPSGGSYSSVAPTATHGRGRGVVVSGTSNLGTGIGKYSDRWWPMSSFEDYEGDICLTND